jgi:hypothetical protein
MDVRRNTLHGYNLGRPDTQEFLAIHDGSLPLRLPEWGRLEFIALLANPGRLIDPLFLALNPRADSALPGRSVTEIAVDLPGGAFCWRRAELRGGTAHM